jgi:hypothetical protein
MIGLLSRPRDISITFSIWTFGFTPELFLLAILLDLIGLVREGKMPASMVHIPLCVHNRIQLRELIAYSCFMIMILFS